MVGKIPRPKPVPPPQPRPLTKKPPHTWRVEPDFQTRDVAQVIDALGAIISEEAERYHYGRKLEIENEILIPEVSKIALNIAREAKELVAMISPIAHDINVSVLNVSQAAPVAVVAGAMREIEASGVPRQDITEEQIMEYIDSHKEIAVDGEVS